MLLRSKVFGRPGQKQGSGEDGEEGVGEGPAGGGAVWPADVLGLFGFFGLGFGGLVGIDVVEVGVVGVALYGGAGVGALDLGGEVGGGDGGEVS